MGVWNKLWNKIKGVFKGEKNETKALPEAQSNQNNLENQSIVISRRDGSTIRLIPMLDKTGNQTYTPVLNAKTGEMQYTHEYTIVDEALSNAQTIHGSSMTKILMDADMNLLKDPTYNYYIADILLDSKRMGEIIDNNEHYAGGLNIGDEGQIQGYHCDEGIIQGLQASRNEKFAIYSREQEARQVAETQKIQENAVKNGVNIKTSHAEALSPQDR